MTDDKPFLARWSQRKLAASRAAAAPQEPAPPAPVTPAPTAAPPAAKPDLERTPELPPVESLTFDSDFRAFLAPKVDPRVRQQALRKLFRDPRFNAMDGLDVYIDDYTRFVPIPEDVIGQLGHAKYLFDPPKTRVNEQGHVEDVPDEPAQAQDEEAPEAPQSSVAALPEAETDAVVQPTPLVVPSPAKS